MLTHILFLNTARAMKLESKGTGPFRNAQGLCCSADALAGSGQDHTMHHDPAAPTGPCWRKPGPVVRRLPGPTVHAPMGLQALTPLAPTIGRRKRPSSIRASPHGQDPSAARRDRSCQEGLQGRLVHIVQPVPVEVLQVLVVPRRPVEDLPDLVDLLARPIGHVSVPRVQCRSRQIMVDPVQIQYMCSTGLVRFK